MLRKTAFFTLALISIAGAAQAADVMNLKIGRPASFAPGPMHVSPYPGYFDPSHDDANYDYWQQKRTERLAAKEEHDRIVFLVQNGYEKPNKDCHERR